MGLLGRRTLSKYGFRGIFYCSTGFNRMPAGCTFRIDPFESMEWAMYCHCDVQSSGQGVPSSSSWVSRVEYAFAICCVCSFSIFSSRAVSDRTFLPILKRVRTFAVTSVINLVSRVFCRVTAMWLCDFFKLKSGAANYHVFCRGESYQPQTTIGRYLVEAKFSDCWTKMSSFPLLALISPRTVLVSWAGQRSYFLSRRS
ncbi:uncharacterized protein LOC131996692 [Stomoxys calcitrans]|uniref:uncharacterized protein LOC131996692 n=1 Tax=Stomoxys calcitrans TaxID=35570 RepID=UPI0027E29CAF|nr:uncharacterized protein LOC131996692 [Stomoxys calcitrans]